MGASCPVRELKELDKRFLLMSEVFAIDPAASNCGAVQYVYQPANQAWRTTILPVGVGQLYDITDAAAIMEQGGTPSTQVFTGDYSTTGGCTSPLYGGVRG